MNGRIQRLLNEEMLRKTLPPPPGEKSPVPVGQYGGEGDA